MLHFRTAIVTATLASAWGLLPAPAAESPAPVKALLEMREGAEKRLTPSSDQVSAAFSRDAAAPGVVVTIRPGKEGYPGAALKPEGAPWNLSAFGHVEARVINCGAVPCSVCLRVDNAVEGQGDTWNTESAYLKPGATGTISTIFGFTYGHKPGYPLDPKAVSQLLLFATQTKEEQSFRIESLAAAGPAGEKPPVDPASIRIKPAGGLLLGAGVNVDAAQLSAKGGAKTSVAGAGAPPALQVVFPAGKDSSAEFKPGVGRWDLRDSLEARVRVRNDGTAPVTPRVRLESNAGPTGWAATPAPLAPGAAAELVMSFVNPVPWRGVKGGETKTTWGEPDTGNRFGNDAVSAVAIAAEKADVERSLRVEEIRAGRPAPPALPDWLGKRPPVEGDWVQTFADEFDGPALDTTKWSLSGPNYWDKKSHWSKDNVIFGGGVVRLRYEKKTGFQNDDPKEKKSAYVAGFLESLGKWTQRYGYFESRMKLPTAPGLWPAFWMMPDRGASTGEQWKRQDTANGGMEFDVLEHLTRWGPCRYNIAMHWDGYGKEHKTTGSEKIYVQPDKDGFLTAGLLWTPGSAIFYCNGAEVARWESPRICTVPCDMMFTLPQGGWDNCPIDDAKLPDDLVIDYVRCWQRKDLAEKKE